MTYKGNPVLKLKNNNFSWNLAFLSYIIPHLNILNLKLQRSGNFIFNMYKSVKRFEVKLKLFVNQMERSDFIHF